MNSSRIVAVSSLALILSGCARQGSSEVAAPPVAATPAQQEQQVITADQVAAKLKAAGAPLTVTKVYSASDDPKHLLGRPNGYTSKVSFADGRVKRSQLRDGNPLSNDRGGTIEVWPDAQGAQVRSQFIQESIKQMHGFLTSEYHYLHGAVLVRVSGLLTQDQARTYDTALAGL